MSQNRPQPIPIASASAGVAVTSSDNKSQVNLCDIKFEGPLSKKLLEKPYVLGGKILKIFTPSESEMILCDEGASVRGGIIRYNPLLRHGVQTPRIIRNIFSLRDQGKFEFELLGDQAVLCKDECEIVLVDKNNKVVFRRDVQDEKLAVCNFKRINATTYLFQIVERRPSRVMLATVPSKNIETLLAIDLSTFVSIESLGVSLESLGLGVKCLYSLVDITVSPNLEGSQHGKHFEILKDNVFMVLGIEKIKFFIYELVEIENDMQLKFLKATYFERRISSCNVVEPGCIVVSYPAPAETYKAPYIKIALYYLDGILKSDWNGVPAAEHFVTDNRAASFNEICLGNTGRTLYCFGPGYSIDEYKKRGAISNIPTSQPHPKDVQPETFYGETERKFENFVRIDTDSSATSFHQVRRSVDSSHTEIAKSLTPEGRLYVAPQPSVDDLLHPSEPKVFEYDFLWDGALVKQTYAVLIEDVFPTAQVNAVVSLIAEYARIFKTRRPIVSPLQITSEDDKPENTNSIKTSPALKGK